LDFGIEHAFVDKTSAERAHRNSVGVDPADIKATSIVDTLAKVMMIKWRAPTAIA
jgi:hypothetical protein